MSSRYSSAISRAAHRSKLDDGASHHMYQLDKAGNSRHWCSEPVEARDLRPEDMKLPLMTPEALFRLIKFNALPPGDPVTRYEEVRVEGTDFERDTFIAHVAVLPSSTRIVNWWGLS